MTYIGLVHCYKCTSDDHVKIPSTHFVELEVTIVGYCNFHFHDMQAFWNANNILFHLIDKDVISTMQVLES